MLTTIFEQKFDMYLLEVRICNFAVRRKIYTRVGRRAVNQSDDPVCLTS